MAATWLRWKNSFLHDTAPTLRSPSQKIATATRDISQFSQMGAADQLASAYQTRALNYLAEHEPRLAEQDLSTIVGISADVPIKVRALQMRAAIYAQCDRSYEAALSDLDSAARLQKVSGIPQDPGADFAQRAGIFGAMGKYDVAVRNVNGAIASVAHWYATNGRMFAPAFDQDKALAHLYATQMALLYAERGYWESRTGDIQSAIKDYSFAINTTQRPSSLLYDWRAAAYLKQGQVGVALADYWRGWRVGPARIRPNPCTH
jgi:tetratricopeptide (TPR) repeat protein